MKKLISTLLSVILLSTLSIPVFAQESASGSSAISASQESGNHYSGLYMPADKFNELYGQKNSPKNLSISKDTEASITMQNVELNKEQVTFTADIEYNNEKKKLAASGTLFNSYKQQEGMNSVVGELTDEASEFKVLLFEIYNDNQATQAITSATLETTPHLKVYLTDTSNNVLLFEIEIPQELRNVKINNDLQPPTTNDLFWFVDVIEPTEVAEIPTTDTIIDMIQKKESSNVLTGVGQHSNWYHPRTYTTTYSSGGSTVTNYSQPYGTWKATDVSSSAGIWTNSFKISEYVTVNGRTISSQNLFNYKNVKLTTSVGGYSTIERALIDGRMIGKSTGDALAMRVANKVWSGGFPGLPSLSTILGWINDIKDSMVSKTVTLGSTNLRLNNTETLVAMTDSLNNSLSSADHNLTLQTDVQYSSSTNSSAFTNGLMMISWDVFLNGSKYESNSKSIEFNYNVKK